jgi:uncharacterized protein YkwD
LSSRVCALLACALAAIAVLSALAPAPSQAATPKKSSPKAHVAPSKASLAHARKVCRKLARKARAGTKLSRKQRLRKRAACRSARLITADSRRPARRPSARPQQPSAPGPAAPGTSTRPTPSSKPSPAKPPTAVPAPAPAPAPTPAPGTCADTRTAPTSANIPLIRAAVLCLVNKERAAAGLGGLVDNGALTAAAQGHSADMVAQRFFSHTSADGRTVAQRIVAAGYTPYRSFGENIAWGSGGYTAESVVKGWMESPGHRANILGASFTESGVGIALGTPDPQWSGVTYTHDFGSR